MEIINVRSGDNVADNQDHVVISKLGSGRYQIGGAVANGWSGIFNPDPRQFEDMTTARIAAINWAESRGCKVLHVVVNDA